MAAALLAATPLAAAPADAAAVAMASLCLKEVLDGSAQDRAALSETAAAVGGQVPVDQDVRL